MDFEVKKGGHHLNHINAYSLSIHATGKRTYHVKKYNLAAFLVSGSQGFGSFQFCLLYTDVTRYALIEHTRSHVEQTVFLTMAKYF